CRPGPHRRPRCAPGTTAQPAPKRAKDPNARPRDPSHRTQAWTATTPRREPRGRRRLLPTPGLVSPGTRCSRLVPRIVRRAQPSSSPGFEVLTPFTTAVRPSAESSRNAPRTLALAGGGGGTVPPGGVRRYGLRSG